MFDIENLPHQKMFTYHRSNSDHPHFKQLIKVFDAELTADYGALQTEYDELNIFPEPINMVLLYDNNTPIGCGGFKPYNATSAEVKRVYLLHEYRNKGLGKGIMLEIEKWVADEGFADIILETGDLQHQAIALYKHMGYHETDKYEPYVNSPASVCFKKNLL